MHFPYVAATDGSASLMPFLPLTLERKGRVTDVLGLVASGSAVNVLPYSVGLALGAVWDEQPTLPPLAGNLSEVEVHALAAMASQPLLFPHASIRLVFAWLASDNAPVIFGQMNFFLEFNVCFYRSEGTFDVSLKGQIPAV